MKKISYINSLGVEFELNGEEFLLQKFESNSNVNIHNSKGIKQDGANYLGNNLDIRDVSLEFTVIGTTNKELIDYKDKINKVFNPKLNEGWIVYKDGVKERKIKCIVIKTPQFSDINIMVSKCLVFLIAHDPYWKDYYEDREKIITWIGGWKFKFKLPFKFKQKGQPRKNIFNEGHVETPIEIIFKGPALNPSVINHTSGEFIKVDRALTSDDILYITTEFGNKKVEIERNGVKQNAFNYIDLDSTFFQLKVGDNMIEYKTENNLDPQSVEIIYRNRYLGI